MKLCVFFVLCLSSLGLSNPIYQAVKDGNLKEIHDALGKYSQFLNIPDKESGVTALHLAAQNGELLFFLALAGHPKTDLQIKDQYERTARDVAQEYGQTRIIFLYDYFLKLKETPWGG